MVGHMIKRGELQGFLTSSFGHSWKRFFFFMHVLFDVFVVGKSFSFMNVSTLMWLFMEKLFFSFFFMDVCTFDVGIYGKSLFFPP